MKINSTFLTNLIEEVTELIEQEMDSENICGLSVAITTGQEILWSKGFGFTDRAKTEPITADTLFSTQSMNKCLTATAFLILATQGLVDLDDPIRKYYPEFTVNTRFGNPDEEIEKMTFRRLLSHWAGFTHEAPIGNNYDYTPCTFEEHIASVSDVWLRSPVGFAYSYANIGIDLTGYVMGLIKNSSYSEVMKTELFLPLGIEKATFDLEEALKLPFAKGFSGLHAVPVVQVAMLPAGGLYISANELAKFVAFHLRRGENKGEQLLDPKLIEEMYTAQFREHSELGYGLGTDRKPKIGEYSVIYHSGGGYGYNTTMDWIPELNVGVVVLTNDMKHSSTPKITTKVFELFAEFSSLPKSVDVEENLLKRLEGTYISYRMPLINVVVEKGKLRAYYANGSILELFPQDEKNFLSKEGYSVRFELGEDGIPLYVHVDHPRWPHVASYNSVFEDPTNVDLKFWKKMEGLYEFYVYGRKYFSAIGLIQGVPHILLGNWIKLQTYKDNLFFTPEGELLNFEDGKLVYSNAISLMKVNLELDNLLKELKNAPIKFDVYRNEISTLVDYLYEIKGTEYTLDFIDRAVKIEKDFQGNYLDLANKLYAFGYFDDAEKCVNRFIKINEKADNALTLRKKIEKIRECIQT